MASQTPDTKAFYGYLFEPDRTPTEILDALLRAIAQHIISDIDDTTESTLTPKKLAAYYRAVGGNYDSLFLNMKDAWLSFVFSTLGCQHTLQPIPGDDFQPPSIPALTVRGFVRWQSVELLLSPSIHVPFLQFVVENWDLKHPDTGAPFPAPLLSESLPSEPDEEMKKWYDDRSEMFREHDTPVQETGEPELEPEPKPEPEPEPEPRRKPKSASSSSASRSSPHRPRHMHVSSDESSDDESIVGRRDPRPRGPGGVNYVYAERPASRRHPEPVFSPVFEDNYAPRRRKSLTDPTSPTRRRSPETIRHPPPLRKLSHPKVNPVIISSDTESPSPKLRSKAGYDSDPALHKLPTRPSVRHVQPGYASPRRGYSPNLRPPVERHEDRRKSFPFEGVKDKLMNTVSSILTGTPDRQRSLSRGGSHGSGSNVHIRGDDYGHRPDRLSPDSDDSDYDSFERGRRRRQREWEKEQDRNRLKASGRGKERYDRDRYRDRDGPRDRGDSLRPREKEPERERERDREHIYDDRPLRPHPRRASPYRRMGSHSDIDRRRVPDNWMDVKPDEDIRHGPPRRRRDGPVAYRAGRD
ncbi:hypothetical protein jhhlp_000911 [Lomentospora prolificans]|uniref:DUF7514 domain-containing protein n=1 Tax=Lomentospora prolificans TaxID=41688 RepID=A0A2N3NJT5_9PEZI|nr:hypothetical protein jhhlp_000911 [Lomentospora prolificans]